MEPRRPRRSLTERDRALLAFAAEHRLILPAHVQALERLATPAAAARRLAGLGRAGYLRSDRLLADVRWHQIDRRGLAAIGSPLPRPRDVDLATYKHDVGLAWLWLAAGRGAFGPLCARVSERQMRSHDRRADVASRRYGTRLPGGGPHGGERRHYPDLWLQTSTGRRIALELELTTKAPRHREEILGGYAVDARIDAVLYLVQRPSVGRAVGRSAAALGLSRLVEVQMVSFGPGSGAIARGARLERTQVRSQPHRPTAVVRG